MKHTCSYLQWNLSIDWNPVSIKYQIHKKIIKICTTPHLKKKDWMNLCIFWTHLEPGFKIYSWKKPFWHSPWIKLEKGQRETGKPTVSKMVQCYHHHLVSKRSIQLTIPVSPNQIQINRTSGIRNTKTISKKLNFTQSGDPD